MLTFTRRTTQTIYIGDHVTVTVLDIQGDRVRIGITAPREIPVQRTEMFHKVDVASLPQ